MTKKILLTILIVVVIAAVGYGIYFFFFSGNSQGGGIQAFDDLFSFDSVGTSENVGLENDNTNNNTNLPTNNIDQINNAGFGGLQPELKKVASKEISGYGMFQENASTTIIRYVDTESGNIFEINLANLSTKRITNTTILQTIDSLWLDKNNLALRYIDENGDVQTFVAEILEESEDIESLGELSGSFLDKNIESVSVSGNRVFALLENSSGSRIVSYSPSLSNESTILRTPLKEIYSSFVGNNTLSINTKPSSKSLGYLFSLNSTGGNLIPLVSEIPGLNSIVSENKDVLYSRSETTGVSLWFLDNKNQELREINKKTLADKCVWGSENSVVYCAVPKNLNIRNMPDEWYKGNVSFSDSIWRIDLETDEMELLFSPEENSGEPVDVVNISLDENNNYLAFVNKKDRSLWVINLAQN